MISNVILWESPSHNPPLSAWGVWKGVIHFLSPPRSGGLRIRGLSWFRDLGFGCLAREREKESEQTGLAFLSLPHQSMCAWIHRLNSRRIICFLGPHTMAILQAYRATSSRKSEGTGLTPEAVKALRRATDLALRATKHTARAVGRLMAVSAAERHLWLNLRGEPFHR